MAICYELFLLLIYVLSIVFKKSVFLLVFLLSKYLIECDWKSVYNNSAEWSSMSDGWSECFGEEEYGDMLCDDRLPSDGFYDSPFDLYFQLIQQEKLQSGN